jgi:hypothetical protein
MTQLGLFVRWIVEQAVWWAPLVGIVGIGVGLIEGFPKERDRRRVALLALYSLAALLVAELGGRTPPPSVSCGLGQWPPVCTEVAGAERAGAEDVGTVSGSRGADDPSRVKGGSGGVGVVPGISAGAGRPDSGKHRAAVASGPVRVLVQTPPACRWLPDPFLGGRGIPQAQPLPRSPRPEPEGRS